MDNLLIVWNIIKAALGVGFVIFIHELGHFAMAKWNGVKVLRFSIGFGPPIISYRKGVGLRVGAVSRPPGPNDPPGWGETEYWLAYIPLGGYVMMFGEGVEGVNASGDGASPEPTEAVVATDPRAYKNKSVWARMQIITAGVIMNVLMGLACFTYVYSQGILEIPAKIGGVLPGSPAYKAGLLAGDEFVAIDGQRDVSFKDLMSRVNHSGAGETVKFSVRRPGTEADRIFAIEPLRDPANLVPTIGVLMPHDLVLFPETPFRAMPGQVIDPAQPKLGFQGEDRVVAVGPEGGPLEAVVDQLDFDRKVEKLRDRPLVVEVERKKAKESDPTQLARVTVPPHKFLDFGWKLTPGPIVAIRPESPAQRAGLKEGDRIEKVDGDPDYDPMTLPEYVRDRQGKTIALAILRAVDGKDSRFDVSLSPDASPAWAEPVDGRTVPLDVPGFGLAISVEPRIKAVAEGSPAAKAGLKPGELIRSMTLTPAQGNNGEEEKSKPKPITERFDNATGNWPTTFAAIQEGRIDQFEVTTDRSNKPIRIIPEVSPERYHPRRGLRFQNLVRQQPPLGLADAARRGTRETIENITNVYKMFRGMSQRRIGDKAVGGLIPIAKITYSAASAGLTALLQILGMFSVGLAVLNFLPIPPLDGGQFLLLAIEKIRGKPLPESYQNVATIGGLVLVLGLIVVINGRDLINLVQSYF